MGAAACRATALALACAACTSIVVDQRTFEGTRWRVTAIDGRPTPAKGDYSLSFNNGRLSARFGCNSIGGSYRASGETLTADRLVSTMMACGEPADSFEHSGSAVLNAPMRTSWGARGRLTLGNSAGSIELDRLP